MSRRAAGGLIGVVLLLGCGRGEIGPDDTLAIVNSEDVVIACWHRGQPIKLSDCAGRTVVDISQLTEGRKGRVAFERFDQVFDRSIPKAGSGWVPGLAEFYPDPVSAATFNERWLADVDLWYDVDAEILMLEPEADEIVALSFSLPRPADGFDPERAETAVRSIVCTTEEDCIGLPIWGDFDQDGVTDGVVNALVPDGEYTCEDVLLVHVDQTYEVKDAASLSARARSGRCPQSRFLEYGESLTASLVPWPSSKLGWAVNLDAGFGGGDVYENFYVPLETLDTGTAVAAAYDARWRYRFED